MLLLLLLLLRLRRPTPTPTSRLNLKPANTTDHGRMAAPPRTLLRHLTKLFGEAPAQLHPLGITPLPLDEEGGDASPGSSTLPPSGGSGAGLTATTLTADIVGPPDTPYAGGVFRCRLVFSVDYPAAPPRGVFLTKIFHPNVSPSGDICVNTLKKDWAPDVGLAHVLQVIRCLLIVPFPESALNEEASRLFLESYDEYFRRAALLTSIHAPKASVAAVAAASAAAAEQQLESNTTTPSPSPPPLSSSPVPFSTSSSSSSSSSANQGNAAGGGDTPKENTASGGGGGGVKPSNATSTNTAAGDKKKTLTANASSSSSSKSSSTKTALKRL